jgi:hypothetical protein
MVSKMRYAAPGICELKPTSSAKAKVKQTGWDVVLEEIQKREIALRVM